MPWERGLADGYKKLDNMALFPAVDDKRQTSWTLWEYLGLYNRIVFGSLIGYEKSVRMVLDERKNTAIELSCWLRAY